MKDLDNAGKIQEDKVSPEKIYYWEPFNVIKLREENRTGEESARQKKKYPNWRQNWVSELTHLR